MEKLDEIKVTQYKTYFQHIYLLSSFDPSSDEKRHNCLGSGLWCFQNFKEHPKDIFSYIRNKLK